MKVLKDILEGIAVQDIFGSKSVFVNSIIFDSTLKVLLGNKQRSLSKLKKKTLTFFFDIF